MSTLQVIARELVKGGGLDKTGQHLVKQSRGPFKPIMSGLGTAADFVAGTGAKLFGRAMAKRPVATTAATGLGLSAANEGLAAANMPHFRWGEDTKSLWSPKEQYFRDQTPGLGQQALGFLKRPIQTIFGNHQPVSLQDLLADKRLSIRPEFAGIDPTTGKLQVRYGGKTDMKLDPATRDALRRFYEMQQMYGGTPASRPVRDFPRYSPYIAGSNRPPVQAINIR